MSQEAFERLVLNLTLGLGGVTLCALALCAITYLAGEAFKGWLVLKGARADFLRYARNKERVDRTLDAIEREDEFVRRSAEANQEARFYD